MKLIESNVSKTPTNGFGDRIKEERQRLKLTQAEFGTLGGVTRASQAHYESERRVPDLNYLASLRDKVDVMYILSGKRATVVKGIDAAVFQTILTEIEFWAKEGQRTLSDDFRAELVALFFQHVVTHGKIDADLIRKTLSVAGMRI